MTYLILATALRHRYDEELCMDCDDFSFCYGVLLDELLKRPAILPAVSQKLISLAAEWGNP